MILPLLSAGTNTRARLARAHARRLFSFAVLFPVARAGIATLVSPLCMHRGSLHSVGGLPRLTSQCLAKKVYTFLFPHHHRHPTSCSISAPLNTPTETHMKAEPPIGELRRQRPSQPLVVEGKKRRRNKQGMALEILA